jgi:DNA replication protein DnaC
MKSLKDVMSNGNFGGSRFRQEVIDKQLCPHGREMLELRQTTVTKNGEQQVFQKWTECLCEIVDETKKKHLQIKVEKFDKFTTKNPDLDHATITNFNFEDDKSQLRALEISLNYIQNFNPSSGKKLLFYGDVGTGKSHLAISIYKEVREKGFTAIYLEMDKIMRIIRETWDKNSESTENEFFTVLQDVDLLVIDDLGAEHSNNWVQEKLFSILNSRLGKSTIITTNLEPLELDKTYTKRVSDRIFDKLSIDDCIKIELKTSYRKKLLLQELMKRDRQN